MTGLRGGRRRLRQELIGRRPPGSAGTGRLSAVSARVDGHIVLTLAGDLDLTTAGHLRAAARRCLRRSPARLSLDVGSVSFCDVAGFRVLGLVRSDAIAVNAEFRLIAISPHILRIFTLMGDRDLLVAAEDGGWELVTRQRHDLGGVIQ